MKYQTIILGKITSTINFYFVIYTLPALAAFIVFGGKIKKGNWLKVPAWQKIILSTVIWLLIFEIYLKFR